jgi:hypothetical protein
MEPSFQQISSNPEPHLSLKSRDARIKILFLAANPRDTDRLRLDEEARAIQQRLRSSTHGERFMVEQEWAVRASDLQALLLRHRPDIVHFSGYGSHAGRTVLEDQAGYSKGSSSDGLKRLFVTLRDMVRFSGHGSQAGRIVLEDQAGYSRCLAPDALERLFGTLKDNIRCAVLNACYTEDQAKAIAGSIGCVVGMSTAIADESAVAFASGFYQALGYGRDVQTAFELGCGQLSLEGLEGVDTPRLITAPGVDARTVFFV